MSHAFWGGSYNPIIFADRPEDAKALVDVFRADLIVPVGDSTEVRNIRQQYPYLITPFLSDELFVDRQHATPLSQVLDIQNLLVHWMTSPNGTQ
jgi:hypothetical protein